MLPILERRAKVNFVLDLPEKMQKLGVVPLHVAIIAGHDGIVSRLLEHGADPNLGNHAGRTALHLAVKKGREAMIETLLRAGVDPDIEDARGRTPLALARVLGQEKMVLKLDRR